MKMLLKVAAIEPTSLTGKSVGWKKKTEKNTPEQTILFISVSLQKVPTHTQNTTITPQTNKTE